MCEFNFCLSSFSYAHLERLGTNQRDLQYDHGVEITCKTKHLGELCGDFLSNRFSKLLFAIFTLSIISPI